MSITTLALGLAYLGSAIGVAMVIPQILRIVRHPHDGRRLAVDVGDHGHVLRRSG